MRPKLFGEAKTRKLDILLTDEHIEMLKEVAAHHALAPSAYARSLIVTHLNRLKAAKEFGND
ncbi:hypothetical protein ASF56_09775 [Methylobacterium sp. Leaf122]|nr:hypothetical protein ASF56_09775 [Methylobacterium sp. Leaf122]